MLLGSFQVPLASTTTAAASTQVETIHDDGKSEPSSTENARRRMTLNDVLINAGKRGLGGGLPGAIAAVVQVFTLMWLRTIINYQCRYGTTFSRKSIIVEETEISAYATS